jgi:hypothetical protein
MSLASLKARGARRAVRRVIPSELTRPDGRGNRRPAQPAGREAPAGFSPYRAGSLALAPGGARRLPPERFPGTARHRLAAVTPAEHACAERPSSRRSSLEPTKITVKSAPACGLCVLRMAFRAAPDCDLGTAHDRAYRKDGLEWRLSRQRRHAPDAVLGRIRQGNGSSRLSAGGKAGGKGAIPGAVWSASVAAEASPMLAVPALSAMDPDAPSAPALTHPEIVHGTDHPQACINARTAFRS